MQDKIEYIVERALKYDLKPRIPGYYYVTDLVGCSAKCFFLYYFNANPHPRGEMVMGRLMHIALEKILSGIEEFREAEFEVPVVYDAGEIKIIGRIDVKIGDVIYEFKLTGHSIFEETGVPETYIAQANAYAVMSNAKEYNIVMVDRRSFKVKVYGPMKPDRIAFEELVKRALRIHTCVKEGRIPREESPLYEWECETKRTKHKCPFHIVCPNYKGGRLGG